MCTTIVLGRGRARVLAYNYDYSVGHGLIATNLVGTSKASVPPPGQEVVRWQVRHGSVTLNSYALELPTCGMNQCGLCIALMWHDGGGFGSDTSVPRLNPMQWIQYSLDCHATVAEVLDDLQRVAPRDDGVPLHFTLLDETGDCALLEFFAGEPRVERDPALPALTNTSYREALAATASGPVDGAASSVGRFAMLRQLYNPDNDNTASSAATFALLSSVAQGGDESHPWSGGATRTVWSVRFVPATRTIQLTTEGNRNRRELCLDRIDLSEHGDYSILDIDHGDGDLSDQLEPYREEENRRILRESARAFPVPDEVQNQIVQVVDQLYRTRQM